MITKEDCGKEVFRLKWDAGGQTVHHFGVLSTKLAVICIVGAAT